MNYKFKVGDKVQIIVSGSGFPPSEIGKIATITETGYYGNSPGYRIKEEYDGNPKTGNYDGFVNEISFKLVSKSEYSPPKYEKGSIVYLSGTSPHLNPVNCPKLYKFYGLKNKGSQIFDPINLTQENLLYVKNNEYIIRDINGNKERIYLVYDIHNRIYLIEESNLDKKQRLSIEKIINNIENILNNIK